eukprot:snap_masked-scaffold_95-processed-gene-0.11-mRNA-1 protein AED:1.00 eAED:1.00 QI:0/0/0/0/1/1/2/0/356
MNKDVIRYYTPNRENSQISNGFDSLNSKFEVLKVTKPDNADFIWCHKQSANIKNALRKGKQVVGGSGLANSKVLEDKMNLSILENSIKEQIFLHSKFFTSKEQVLQFLDEFFLNENEENTPFWILKESGGNCGSGLNVIYKHNYKSTIEGLRTSELDLVLQEYIANPSLWNGKHKFHYRIFIILKATANNEYTQSDNDAETQFTNVAMNVHDDVRFKGCPVYNLAESGAFLDELKNLLKIYFHEAVPFMINQTNKRNFVHIGADVMFKENDGRPFVLEFNIPPSTGMYGKKMPESNIELYQEMFSSIASSFFLGEDIDEDLWIPASGKLQEVKEVPNSITGLNNVQWQKHKNSFLK